MPKDRFNEAEKYLIQNWRQAYLVQTSMEEIRRKYAVIFGRVWESLKASHEELDLCGTYVTQFWGSGYMVIGREAWKAKGFTIWDMGGIGINNLRLENLLDDDADTPEIAIWTGKAKRRATDLAGVQRIRSAASRALAKDEFGRCQTGPGDYDVLWYNLPETREELTRMLIEGDGQRFADCLVAHFEVFAKLIPVLNEVFGKRV